jgi:hypothetical protein
LRAALDAAARATKTTFRPYLDCVAEEARRNIDAAKQEYSDAVDAFNRRARQ